MKYTLTMCVANIKHTSWWWYGKPTMKFETIEGLISFMRSHIPLRPRDMLFIIENDKKQEHGRLACTSWYEVRKGDPMMTEYTSF